MPAINTISWQSFKCEATWSMVRPTAEARTVRLPRLANQEPNLLLENLIALAIHCCSQVRDSPSRHIQNASKLLLSASESCAIFLCEKLTTQDAMLACVNGSGRRLIMDFQL